MEEIKNGYTRSPLPAHGDSMKRHLEVYDVEASLNEVCSFLNQFGGMEELIETDHRDEHPDFGFFETLRYEGPSNTAFGTGDGIASVIARS